MTTESNERAVAGSEADAPRAPRPAVGVSRYARRTRHLPHLQEDPDYHPDAVPLPKPVEAPTLLGRIRARRAKHKH